MSLDPLSYEVKKVVAKWASDNSLGPRQLWYADSIDSTMTVQGRYNPNSAQRNLLLDALEARFGYSERSPEFVDIIFQHWLGHAVEAIRPLERAAKIIPFPQNRKKFWQHQDAEILGRPRHRARPTGFGPSLI